MIDLGALKHQAESAAGDRCVVSRSDLMKIYQELKACRDGSASGVCAGQCFGLPEGESL